VYGDMEALHEAKMTFTATLLKDGKSRVALIEFNPNQKQEIKAMLIGAGFEVEDNLY